MTGRPTQYPHWLSFRLDDGLYERIMNTSRAANAITTCRLWLIYSFTAIARELTARGIKTPMGNLVTMVYSRGSLISKATDGRFACPLEQVEILKDCLTVESVRERISPDLIGLTITNDAITFTGFPLSDDPEKIQAFTQLAAQMNRLAKEQKRTQAKAVDTTNEKYIFRIWLLALGMDGDEFKTARRVLLAPLSGNAAFKDQAMEERWKEKQAAKRDALRDAKTAQQFDAHGECDAGEEEENYAVSE